MLIASTSTREGEWLPVGLAIGAWLLPAGFGLWGVAQLGLQGGTAEIPEPVLLGWLGAILGALVAAASLVLMVLRKRSKLPIAAPTHAKALALAQIAFTAAITAVIMSGL